MVTLFSYKAGNSFLHKTPAWIKLLFIPLVNITFLFLPPYFVCGLVAVQFIIACFLHFTLKEQLTDVKPVLYYAVLLYGFKLVLWVAGIISGGGMAGGAAGGAADAGAATVAAASATASSAAAGGVLLAGDAALTGGAASTFRSIFDSSTFFLLLKLFCIMQSASLVFKTSTLLQLREGIEQIEAAVRKILHLKKQNTFTDAISMFLNFIPMTGCIWEQEKKAWKARGGKKGIKMYAVLLPVLFSVGMKKAYNQARAISIRNKI